MSDIPGNDLWMVGLLAIWAGLLFGGFVFGNANAERTHRMPTWTRMGSSLTLVIAGWSWWLTLLAQQPLYLHLRELALFIAIGMTLGFIGDLFMAGLIPVKERVLGGIAAFGLGHIAYIAGMLIFRDRIWLDEGSPPGRSEVLIAWLVIGAILWYVVVFRGGARTFLHMAALPYALLLSGTTGIATGLALQNSSLIVLAVGAALFLFSDLLLAAQLFNNLHFPLIGDAVWLLYGPGQMMIVFGIFLRYTRGAILPFTLF